MFFSWGCQQECSISQIHNSWQFLDWTVDDGICQHCTDWNLGIEYLNNNNCTIKISGIEGDPPKFSCELTSDSTFNNGAFASSNNPEVTPQCLGSSGMEYIPAAILGEVIDDTLYLSMTIATTFCNDTTFGNSLLYARLVK